MVKKAARAPSNSLLRAARKERGWTQQQVADLIGSPQVLNVTRWERGTVLPSAFYTQKLCQIFGKTPGELGVLVLENETFEEKSAPDRAGYWNVPYRRNPFFTGREDLLLRLEQTLLSGSHAALTQSYALSGLGGIGKTQVAVEYAYRSRPAYQAIFWVRAERLETLIADFSAIAHLLNVPQREHGDQQAMLEAVLRWFQHKPGWLLILDNADDLALIEEFVPSGGQGHLLLTTRAQATGELAQSIEVEKLGVQESILLLLHRAKLLAPPVSLERAPASLLAQARTLAKELDGLPLALDQAAAYMEESGCSLSEYLLLYQEHQMEMLKRGSQVLPHYPSTVARTWSLSFQQVEKANPAAANLLRICAFLDADAIPEAMLSEGAAHLGPELAEALSDTLLWNEALRTLRRYSLVRRQPALRLLSIHRLVQVVIQAGMDEEMRRLWAERAVGTVDAVLRDPLEATNWPHYQQCLPHAQKCAELIEHYGIASPEAARLLDHAGCYLRERGQYREAESLLQQALFIRERLLGPEHATTAETLDHLAYLFMLQGRYEQAETLLQRVLPLREREPDGAPLSLIETLHHLANVSYFRHHYEQAESLYQRALLFQEHVRGPLDSAHSDILNSLALLNQAQGKYDNAESLYLRALTLFEQAFGSEHPDVAIMLNNLGGLYCLQGRFDEAEPVLVRALRQHERDRGPDHPFVADTLCNLGEVSSHRGHYRRAEELLQRSLAIKKHTLGAEHPHVASTLTCLADLFFLQGRYEQAEPLYRGALSIQERVANPENNRTATTLYNLSRLYACRGQEEEADPLMHRALLMRERVLGPLHPETVSMREEYSQLCSRLNQV